MTETAPARESRLRERIFWSALAVATTAVLVAFREEIGGAHVALTYLLIVLGASARGGRRLGTVLALLGFLSFNYFFIQPYYTFTIHRPLDWLVLVAFLVTSAVATQLLHRAQAETEAARRRAHEIDRLAALGAETLNVGRAEDAVVAIAQVMQSGLNVAACEIYSGDGSSREVHRLARATVGRLEIERSDATDPRFLYRAAAGLMVAERPDGTSAVARDGDLSALELLLTSPVRTLLIPLKVRDSSVGVLRLTNFPVISLDPSQRRFAEALSYYAALGLERVRLTAAAEHAEALREADRLKDTLLASVSHDLRTPLTAIKALAHDLADGGDPRAVVVEKEADRLNRFVSDLLDLSRLNAGAPVLNYELIAAEDVIGAALQQFSSALDGRTISAFMDKSEPLLVGRFDFTYTLRALVNLIDNALKYSPQGTTVDVSARQEEDWLAFEVADRSGGIAAADQERIFDAFYRGIGASDIGGSGLGLAIARRSVELQGGRLLFSPRSGGGSRFTIYVPVASGSDMEAMSL